MLSTKINDLEVLKKTTYKKLNKKKKKKKKKKKFFFFQKNLFKRIFKINK